MTLRLVVKKLALVAPSRRASSHASTSGSRLVQALNQDNPRSAYRQHSRMCTIRIDWRFFHLPTDVLTGQMGVAGQDDAARPRITISNANLEVYAGTFLGKRATLQAWRGSCKAQARSWATRPA